MEDSPSPKRQNTENNNNVQGLDFDGESCEQVNTDDEKKAGLVIERTELRRHLSLLNLVALMVSITGHVAIFMTPGSIVALSGSIVNTTVIWFVGGFFVYSLALCFAELGTLFQRAGGPYLFIRLTFGPLLGFLIAWGYIIMISGPFMAWTSYTTAIYIVGAIVNEGRCEGNSSYDHDQAATILAGLIIVMLCFLNCRHLTFIVRVQSVLTMAKMVLICTIILAGAYAFVTGPSETFDEPMRGSVSDPGRISLAILVVVFSNGGWQAVTSLTEEVKNPARTLPLALHLTFLFSVGVNFLVFLAYMLVLEVGEIKGSDAIALLFWQRLCPPIIPVVSAAVGLASIGALNTAMMGHSRVLMAAARDGVLPKALCTLNPNHHTPILSLITISCYGILMLLVGTAAKMVQFIGLFSFIMGFFMALAVVYLRYTRPDLPRPYKAPSVFPWLQLFVNGSMCMLVVYQEPAWMLIGFVIFFAGIPLYLLGNAPFPRWQSLDEFSGKVTALIQKCLVLVHAD